MKILLIVLGAIVIIAVVKYFSTKDRQSTFTRSSDFKDQNEEFISNNSDNKELKTDNKIEIKTRTRFFIDENLYHELLKNPNLDFHLNVVPKKGNHPKGHYHVPNNIIISFIQSKRGARNWELHSNFHQDSIPKELRNYFNKK